MQILNFSQIVAPNVAKKVAKKDSSSSDSSDDSDCEPAQKKPVVKAPLTNGKVKATNGKSSSSEDSSEEEAPAKKPKISNSVANKSVSKKKDSSSSSSDSSDESDEKEKPLAKALAKLAPTNTSTPNTLKYGTFVSGGVMQPTIKKLTEGESSSEDSSESDEKTNTKPVIKNGVTPNGKKRNLSASEDNETSVAKKAKQNNSFNKSSNSKPNTPFRRVKDEDIEVDTRLSNNSFDAKVNSKKKKNYTDILPMCFLCCKLND